VETAFWLESDRMMGLALTEQSVEIQKGVVIEEFKQQHLNRPYGDVQHLIRSIAFEKHPYQWPTIGKCTEHIDQATWTDVMDFYHRFYVPGNAILSVVGNISAEDTFRLAEKWFGDIPKKTVQPRALPQEQPQKRIRRKTVMRDVPADMLVMAFHMPERKSHDYHTCDLITDLLAAGQSSRLNQHLVHRDKPFTSIDAYIQGSSDEGLLLVVGRLVADVAFADAEEAVWRELKGLKEVSIDEAELAKVRNRSESERTFNNINYLNRAVNMAQLELIGQDSELADELRRYCAITAADVQRVSRNIFMKRNCCILKVLSKQS
jgi:predicted Zn-dependent peptidase